MRTCLPILFLFFVSACASEPAPVKKPQPPELAAGTVPADSLPLPRNGLYMNFPYQKAVAFARFEWGFDSDFVEENGTYFNRYQDTFQVVLDTMHIRELRDIVDGKQYRPTEKDHIAAGCFTPRHNIIFQDSLGRVVQYISVCFECNRIKSSMKVNTNVENFRAYFNSIGLKVHLNPMDHEPYFRSLYEKRHAP